MPDTFQFYSNSADVPPGKGTGETLESSPTTYADLRSIKNWRRILSEKSEGFETVLKHTGSAELWQGIPRKPSVRREDLETLRKELLEVQRTIPQTAEMSAAEPPKSKKPRATKKAAVAPLEEDALSNVPEGAVAVPQVLTPPSQQEDAPEDSSTIRFCPICRYYLYLQMAEDFPTGATPSSVLVRLCRNCGYREEDKKGGLVSEILVKERSAEGYKILLNEFTTRDYRLPHIRGSLKCPTSTCESNTKGTESDIIYLKDDQVNLTYLYICMHCNTQWRSRR